MPLGLYSCDNEDGDGEVSEDSAWGVGDESTTPDEPGVSLDDILTYENPIIKTNEGEWKDYGVGDPFVMRYNGQYYLYSSSKDGQTGVQCFRSDDLVNWLYMGLCADDAITKGAYAPEVVYYNGYFYMYTSPGGNGHYVLRAELPTGPFVPISDNFGLSIDGSVFIDDDGSWYFYSAANGGINVFPMSAPNEIDASGGRLIPCDMNGWTEGPMVVKHDGVYYMTYTGNHVWSPGYRINCAVSTTQPTEFTPCSDNPIVLSTDKSKVMGTGHSSTVLGPNLDEYYIVYHSYENVGQRNMNIDRIVFNGKETVVSGPTVSPQAAPSMPDIYSKFERQKDLEGWNIEGGRIVKRDFVLSEGGRVLSCEAVDGDYTAEYNLESTQGVAGIIFSYKDEQNFGRAVYTPSTSELVVEFAVNGNTTQRKITLSASFSDVLRGDALICFRIIRSGEEYSFFANNRLLLKCESELGGGHIGVFSEKGETVIGFLGASGEVLQSSAKELYKPSDCPIPAFTALESEHTEVIYDGVRYLRASEGGKYTYKVNTGADGQYDLIIEYRARTRATLELYQNGERLCEFSLSSTLGRDATVAIRGLSLCEGLGKLSFTVKSGEADLLSFRFHPSEDTEETVYDFSGSSAVSYKDGEWSERDGRLVLDGEYGKYLVGSEGLGNYIVESDICITSESANAGLIVRATNPGTRDDAPHMASDYLQGYFIGLGDGCVILGKHNYDWQELLRINRPIEKGVVYHLRVVTVENTITVSLNGEVVFAYTDNNSPFLHGMVGYRAHASTMEADNLSVRPIS